MNKQELQKAIICLSAMSKNFNATIDKELMSMWIKLLEKNNATSQEISDICERVIENYEFKTLPPFAVLKKELDNIRGILAISQEDCEKKKAGEAFTNVWEAIGAYGSYGNPPFDPRTADTVRQMGGWHFICQSWTESTRPFRQKEFVERYVLNTNDFSDQLALAGSDSQKLTELVKELAESRQG